MAPIPGQVGTPMRGGGNTSQDLEMDQAAGAFVRAYLVAHVRRVEVLGEQEGSARASA